VGAVLRALRHLWGSEKRELLALGRGARSVARTPERVIKELDHGWFVGLVGDAKENRPRYAVAVILEDGGSGGKSAGPIANQVIHALIAEGYLDGDPRSRPARREAQPTGEHEVEPTGGAG
jgi:hypothetical protein